MEPRQQFRIPTLLALLVIGGLTAVVSLLSNNARLLFGRAVQNPDVIPQSVEITSVSDKQALIYWRSRRPIGSTIYYQNKDGWIEGYDVQDQDNTPKQYILHTYHLTNLSPETSTVFEIRIGNQPVYRTSVMTGPALSSQPQTLPLYGDAFSTGEHGLVKATIGDSASWTIPTTNDSNWALPLSNMRTANLATYYCEVSACTDDTTVNLEFISSTATEIQDVTLRDARPYTRNIPQEESRTIPPEAVTNTPALAQNTREKNPVQVLAATNTLKQFSILSPTENASLTFPKPLFRGEGTPGEEVVVHLSGDVTQIGKTAGTEKGIWQWTPGYPLSPGKYIVTVTSRQRTLTRAFTILSSGKQVLSASTPSATLIPTIESPTIFPTTPPTVSSPTPTLYVTAGPALSVFFIGGGTLLLFLALSFL
jgi:hypothetical protein